MLRLVELGTRDAPKHLRESSRGASRTKRASGRRTTISFYGTHDDAKAFAKKADMQIDGLEPSATSPVQSGGEGAGGAPLEKGATEFQNARTRPSLAEQSKNLGTSMRRRSNQI